MWSLPQLTLQFHRKKTAPTRASSTNDSQITCFTPDGSNSIYKYEFSTDKWEGLPPCPYRNSGLVTIGGEITAVGRIDKFTLRQRKWVKEYPPMNTARSSPAVVCTTDGEYVIVIGGEKIECLDNFCWTTSSEKQKVVQTNRATATTRYTFSHNVW